MESAQDISSRSGKGGFDIGRFKTITEKKETVSTIVYQIDTAKKMYVDRKGSDDPI